MNRRALNRYERTADDVFIIDVTAARVEDLYNNFDRTAPYVRRDLDQELVEYLTDCAREISPRKFLIRFTLGSAPQGPVPERIGHSIENFFLYLADRERRSVHRMLRTSLIFLGTGLAILAFSIWLSQVLVDPSVVGNVFTAGLTVAAWVALWEALATFLVAWPPLHRDIRLYRQLATATLVFNLSAASTAQTLPT